MPLYPHFTPATPAATGFTWIKLDHTNPGQEALLADELAELIMRGKLQGMAHIFNSWLTKRNQNLAIPQPHISALEGIISICIGTQAVPKPDDHRQGWVAEHLWYFLVNGSYPSVNLVRIFDVGISSTDPGGDGLVIHRKLDGSLYYRLWELKKVAGSATTTVDQTISKAAGQLSANGVKYISRYVIQNQNQVMSVDEKNFLNEMIECWLSSDPRASVGIATISATAKLTSPNFNPLTSTFTAFAAQGSLEGRTIAIQNFDNFCDLVCRSIWKGI